MNQRLDDIKKRFIEKFPRIDVVYFEDRSHEVNKQEEVWNFISEEITKAEGEAVRGFIEWSNYRNLSDNQYDSYEDWLSDQDIDDVVEWVDEYVRRLKESEK